MINSYNALMKKKYQEVDESLVYPLSVWLSNWEINAPISQKLNRNIFYIDKNVAKSILCNCVKVRPFLKYPKPKKIDNKKMEILYKYLIDEYKYGKSDMSSLHKLIINLANSKGFVEEFCDRYGLDNSERKIMGLKPVKFDKKKMEPKKVLIYLACENKNGYRKTIRKS